MLSRSSQHSFSNKFLRSFWGFTQFLAFRPTPKIFHGWRRLLLRAFGARVGNGAVVHPSVKIWAPWNLVLGDHACLGPHVDCYNCEPVSLGEWAVVSQYSFLCTATHDYTDLEMPLIAQPITIGAYAWICADSFLGPGVQIGEGAVIGARSSVYSDVDKWTVVGGNPARFLKPRVLREVDEYQCPHINA